MECLLTFLVLLTLFLVVTGGLARAHSRSSSRRRVYRAVAKRFAGQVLPGSVFSRMGIRFRYGERRATYREARPMPPLTGRCGELVMDWPNARTRIELYRNPVLIPPSGFRPVPQGIDSQEFAKDYVIVGGDDPDTAQLLSEGVRWQLHRLRLLGDSDNLFWRIHHGRMTVQKQGRFRREAELAQFVQLVFELYDQAMLTQVVGIDFLESDSAQPLENVICKVCGDAIEHEMVCCLRCKTPHHQDCWTYNGACSVYGCLETRCVAPRAVQPLEAADSHPASFTPHSTHAADPSGKTASENRPMTTDGIGTGENSTRWVEPGNPFRPQ